MAAGDWITRECQSVTEFCTPVKEVCAAIELISEAVTSMLDQDRSRSSPAAAAESIPDARYQSACVICVEPHEDGERCSVLPGCGHMFHRDCVAAWLRTHATCPLCRAPIAAAAADDDDAVARQGNSTAQDMV